MYTLIMQYRSVCLYVRPFVCPLSLHSDKNGKRHNVGLMFVVSARKMTFALQQKESLEQNIWRIAETTVIIFGKQLAYNELIYCSSQEFPYLICAPFRFKRFAW